MNREIKFRAWDKKTNKMREIDSISFHNKRGSFDFDDSRLPKVYNVWGYDIIEQKDYIIHREDTDIILMQYTGLKDKNGKEIYEGDIIASDKGMIVEIHWNDLDAVFACRNQQTKFHPNWTLGHFITDGIRVIGNIHESPDISPETLATVKDSLCADCGAGCTHPEQCEAFVDECRKMEVSSATSE